MRVLVGSLSRHFGGVESLFRSIIQANDREDLAFDFICTDSSAANEKDFVAAGSKVYHIPRPSGNLKGFINRFRTLFKEGGYDIYHVNLTRFRFPLDVIIAKSCGVKVVLHCHSTRIYNNVDKKTQVIRDVEQTLFRPVMLNCSNKNIACSGNAGEYLYGKKPFEILHNGIHLENYLYNEEGKNRIREEFGIQGCRVIGHIGRFSVEKNHIFFLSIAGELIKMDDNYRFICVGDGELRESIIRDAEKAGILSHCIFPGQREDIGDLLSSMDVYLFPSIHEALPITLIEAQANGLPCIVSDCVTDEIDVGDLITRVSLQEDPLKWAEIINKVAVGKRITTIQKSVNGLEEFSDFDIANMVSILYDKYKSLL